MEAIDFQKLLLEERKKKKRQQQRSTTTNCTRHSSKKDYDEANNQKSVPTAAAAAAAATTPASFPLEPTTTKRKLPDWPHPPGFLSLTALALNVLCKDPPTISYSPTSFHEDDYVPSSSEETGLIGGGSNFAPSSQQQKVPLLLPSKALQAWLAHLPVGESGMAEWKTMSFGKRRVCMFGEDVEETLGRCVTEELTRSSLLLPPPLQEIADQLVEKGIFPPESPPNHVLLNEYQPGQGIMPHTDGPAYVSCTATLSLCSSIVMEFTPRRQQQRPLGEAIAETPRQPPLQVLLEPNSLLVFEQDAYLEYCHGIPMNVWQDTTTGCCLNAVPNQSVPRAFRYSLTFRHKKKKELQT